MADSQLPEVDLDNVIDRLLEGERSSVFDSLWLADASTCPWPRCTVRGSRPGKPVHLEEYEIKYLCLKARDIFINQPILLELEAPIKICGM